MWEKAFFQYYCTIVIILLRNNTTGVVLEGARHGDRSRFVPLLCNYGLKYKRDLVNRYY